MQQVIGLINSILSKYETAIQEDRNNTDSIFFILEETANELQLCETEFDTLSRIVYKKMERLGL